MKKKIIVPLMAIALICFSVINYSTIQSANDSGVTLRSLVKISSAESEFGNQCTLCGNYVNELCPDCGYYCYNCCICEPEPESCPNCYSTSGCDCANTDCSECGYDLVSCRCTDFLDDECDVCGKSHNDCECSSNGTSCYLCGGDPSVSCPNCY